MRTDRAPFDYRYMSGRLLADLFQHDDAARSRWKVSGEISAWLATLNVARADRDHANLHELAYRAADLVSDQTGTLSYSGAADYIKDQCEFRFGFLEPHLGWQGGRVACYSTEITTHEGERVFVALFGSASNVIGYRDAGGSGYVPSDIHGLYTMLDLAREPDDPEIDFRYRWDDGRLPNEVRARIAIEFAQMGATKRVGVHDFLAQKFIEVEDYLGEGFSGRVILGTPLWVASPRPVSPRRLPHRAQG